MDFATDIKEKIDKQAFKIQSYIKSIVNQLILLF